MSDLPVEILVGVSFGLLTGVLPAVAVGASNFGTTYATGRSIPTPAVAVLALPLVGASASYANVVAIETALDTGARVATVGVVGVLLSLVAASQGEHLARTLPRNVGAAVRPERTLSGSAVDAVDSAGQVTVRPAGRVADLDGYPPLPPALRDRLSEDSWRLPADLPLSELADRLEDRLRTEYNLAAVSVSMDPQGRATIAAAPPARDLAKQVPEGYRAVSVRTVAPAGLAPGDAVAVRLDGTAVDGTVLSVGAGDPAADDAVATDGTASGGETRVTVAVPTAEAGDLLAAETAEVVARSAGTTSAFEAFSLLSAAGRAVRKVVVGDGDSEALATEDVEVLAVRDEAGGWRFDPDLATLSPGQVAFVSGSTASDALRRFEPSATPEGGERA